MKHKKSQLIMLWLLPLVVIGGWFFPLLGFLVAGMMIILLTIAFFKGRYWCWNLCPRGAFLDIVMSKFSLHRPTPEIFRKFWFRLIILILFTAGLIFRLVSKGGDLFLIGGIFVSMCILTTVISIVLAVVTKHRGWCMICPMGTLQEFIGGRRKSKREK